VSAGVCANSGEAGEEQGGREWGCGKREQSEQDVVWQGGGRVGGCDTD
jgi:hypothetical protein